MNVILHDRTGSDGSPLQFTPRSHYATGLERNEDYEREALGIERHKQTILRRPNIGELENPANTRPVGVLKSRDSRNRRNAHEFTMRGI